MGKAKKLQVQSIERLRASIKNSLDIKYYNIFMKEYKIPEIEDEA